MTIININLDDLTRSEYKSLIETLIYYYYVLYDEKLELVRGYEK